MTKPSPGDPHGRENAFSKCFQFRPFFVKSLQLGPKPARRKAERLEQNNRRGGLGKTRKHPQWCRDVARVLYEKTDMTLAEIAALFPEIPEGTIKSWSLAIPVPPHRAGVQGSRPADLVAVLEKENSELKTQLESAMMRLEAFELSPQSTDNLLARARIQLRAVMAVAKPGELATILASLQKIKLAEELMTAENEKAKRFGQTPKWFTDWITTQGPLLMGLRPTMTDHDRGIVPEETEEDAGDLDPTVEPEESDSDNTDDEGADDDE